MSDRFVLATDCCMREQDNGEICDRVIRLIASSIENELRAELTEAAEDGAIKASL